MSRRSQLPESPFRNLPCYGTRWAVTGGGCVPTFCVGGKVSKGLKERQNV